MNLQINSNMLPVNSNMLPVNSNMLPVNSNMLPVNSNMLPVNNIKPLSNLLLMTIYIEVSIFSIIIIVIMYDVNK